MFSGKQSTVSQIKPRRSSWGGAAFLLRVCRFIQSTVFVRNPARANPQICRSSNRPKSVLVVNFRTAKALGRFLPESFLCARINDWIWAADFPLMGTFETCQSGRIDRGFRCRLKASLGRNHSCPNRLRGAGKCNQAPEGRRARCCLCRRCDHR
jgi:hypothetical protein